MKNEITNNFYADLDSLLDTRLGLLKHLYPDKIDSILSGGYLTRNINDFPSVGITALEWLGIWENRTAECLTHSLPTNVMPQILVGISEAYEEAGKGPDVSPPMVTVNVYPYIMDATVMSSIKAAVSESLLNTAEVTVTYIKPEDLTPRYFDANFDFAYVYDPVEWLAKIAKPGYKIVPCSTTMFSPFLFRERLPTEVELKEISDSGTNPIKATEFLYKPFIKLELLEASVFSAYT